MQVLALIGRGLSIPQIAEKLFRSQKTIETHRHSLGRKLGVSNRVELARIAIQEGLAPLDDGRAVSATLGKRDNVRSRLSSDVIAAQLVHGIELACATTVGDAYFSCLVEQLKAALNVSAAGVCSFDDEPPLQSRVIVARHREQWVRDFEVPQEVSPCAEVVKHGFVRFDGNLPQQYPRFTEVFGVEIHSFMAISLNDPASSEPIGSLVVFQDDQTPFSAETETVLRVCGERAAAELDRARLIDSLQRSVETLEQRLAEKV